MMPSSSPVRQRSHDPRAPRIKIEISVNLAQNRASRQVRRVVKAVEARSWGAWCRCPAATPFYKLIDTLSVGRHTCALGRYPAADGEPPGRPAPADVRPAAG
jgi:hypothetical protein